MLESVTERKVLEFDSNQSVWSVVSPSRLDFQEESIRVAQAGYATLESCWSEIAHREDLYAFKIDPSGIVREISASFAEALDSRPDDLVSRHLTTILFANEDGMGCYDRVIDIFEQGWDVFECRFAFRRENPIEALVLAYPVKEENGNVYRVRGIVIDLTHFKEEAREMSLALRVKGGRLISVPKFHHLNNTLKKVEGFLSLSQERLDPFHELNEFFDCSRSLRTCSWASPMKSTSSAATS